MWMPRAVTCLAVGIDGAAVPHRLQRIDGLHHIARGDAVQRGDQADAAGVMLGQVEMGCPLQRGAAGGIGGDEGGTGFVLRHGRHSAAMAGLSPRAWM